MLSSSEQGPVARRILCVAALALSLIATLIVVAPSASAQNAADGQIWEITNRVHGRFMSVEDTAEANVVLSEIQDTRSQWRIATEANGLSLQNVATGEYLDADFGEEDYNVNTSLSVELDDQWNVIHNADGSIQLKNADTNYVLDGDSATEANPWNVDQSSNAGDDDGWFVRVVNGPSVSISNITLDGADATNAPGPELAAGQATLSYTVTNNGNGALSGVTFSPGNSCTFSGGIGDTATCTAVVPIAAPAQPGLITVSGTDASGTAATVTRAFNYRNPSVGTSYLVIADYGDSTQAAQDVVDLGTSLNPDVVVGAGDGRYFDVAFDTVAGQYCAWHADVLPGPNCPNGGDSPVNRFVAAAGNHEYDDAGGIQEYLDYFTMPGAGVPSLNTSGTELFYDAIHGPMHFFVIDSEAAVQSIASRAAQGDWLEEALAASTSPWKVVVSHHPVQSSAVEHGSQPEVNYPYAAWGADFVLQGHDHVYERSVVDGVTYLTSGLGGRSLYNFGNPIPGSQFRYRDNYGSLLLEATDTQVTGSFYTIDGQVLDPFTVTNDQTQPTATPTPTVVVPSSDCATSGTSGFSFVDDAETPQYTSGIGSSGQLSVTVGGVDDADITNMRGAWSRSCTLGSAETVTVSVNASMAQASEFESDEWSELRIAIDGTSYPLTRLTGNGNGGNAQSVGPQVFTQTVALPAGSHVVDLVCFNNKKTFNDETTNCTFADIAVTIAAAPTATPTATPVLPTATPTATTAAPTPTPTVVVPSSDCATSGTSGFSFVDDAETPQYTSGIGSSGQLSVTVGGVDDADITNMRGAWSRSCTLGSAETVTVSVNASMAQASEFESDEWSELRIAIDGTSYPLTRLTGNGNGGNAQSVGPQVFTQTVALPAGSHVVDLVCFNNKKTFNDETTNCTFADIAVTISGGQVPTPTPTPEDPTPTPTAVAPTGPTVLTNGVTVTGLQGPAGSEQFFVIDVPAGSGQLQVVLTGTGDADLYVQAGTQPTQSAFDCRPYFDGNSNETCTITAPLAGQHFIMVRGWTQFSNGTLTASISGAAPTGPTVLQDGEAATGLSGAPGDMQDFAIDIPAGVSQVTFTMSGGGDADLYVRNGLAPSLANWDCRPLQDLTSNEVCTINNPQQGRWFFSAFGYGAFSNLSMVANFTTQPGGGDLTSGVPVTGIAAAQNEFRFYTIEVPAGTASLNVEIGGGTGDADLYVRDAGRPNLAAWDCRPFENGSTEVCTIANPSSGTWHIGVQGYTDFAGLTLTATTQ